MIVDVPPVRVPDVPDAVLRPGAIGRVRQSNPLRVIRRRKCEQALRAVRRQERVDLRPCETRSERRRPSLFDEATGGGWRIRNADSRVVNRGAEAQKGAIERHRILDDRSLTLAQDCAVPAVLNLAADDGDAEDIAGGVRRIRTGLVHAVFDHIGPSAAVEPPREIDIGVRRVGVPVTETGGPQRRRFADGEFNPTVALRNLL